MSSPRGRRQAALPPSGFRRPSAIDESGLVFTLFGENGGVEGVYSFGDLPGSVVLRRAIVCGFAEVCGPGRDWTSRHSAENGLGALRSLLAFACARPDPPQVAQHLTPALLAGWRQSLGATAGARKMAGLARRVLLGAPGVPMGIGPALRWSADGAMQAAEPQSYSLEEFERIRAAAASMFNTALTRIRGNRRHLRRWYAGDFEEGSEQWLRGQALEHVLRTGDVPGHAIGSGADGWIRVAHLRALGGEFSRCRNELYLDTVELFGLHVLLVATEAWNRSVLAKLTVPEHDPAAADGFDIHMMEIDKRRRPVRLRHTSNNLVDDGPDSPGRLMAQAIEATELARQTMALLGHPTKLLLVARGGVSVTTPRGGFVFGVTKTGTNVFAERVGLTDAAGARRTVTLRPLRRTVQVRIRKEPSHNSQDTHDSIYVLRDVSTPEATADTIAQGLVDALEHARTVTTMKMMLGDAADVLLELADHPELAQAVISGAADTATAACTGFTDSPHAEPGQPCRASFLLCLGCRNAIGTPRHLPRLVYLHSCLDSLRATVGESVWDLDWREHWLRLESLMAVHTTAPQRADALRRLTERDRALIDDLLRRRLDP